MDYCVVTNNLRGIFDYMKLMKIIPLGYAFSSEGDEDRIIKSVKDVLFETRYDNSNRIPLAELEKLNKSANDTYGAWAFKLIKEKMLYDVTNSYPIPIESCQLRIKSFNKINNDIEVILLLVSTELLYIHQYDNFVMTQYPEIYEEECVTFKLDSTLLMLGFNRE
jgi:hypothetical protein